MYFIYKVLCRRGRHDWEPTEKQGVTKGVIDTSYLVDECTRCPAERRLYS